jgi:hypothetical protein
MEKSTILGRIFLATEQERASELIKQFRPMLRSPRHVKSIFTAVNHEFADETPENRRLIFIACVYQSYQPLSFLPAIKSEENRTRQAAGKLPVGVRDEMSRCLGFNNPEMASHFKQFTEPQMKPFNTGPERPFKLKVMSIIAKFKVHSINADDHYYSMGL